MRPSLLEPASLNVHEVDEHEALNCPEGFFLHVVEKGVRTS